MGDSNDEKIARLKGLLEDQHSWPGVYTFKFIVPVSKVAQILAFFDESYEISHRPSKKGNYISVTVKREMNSADDVIRIYQSVSVIEGLITL